MTARLRCRLRHRHLSARRERLCRPARQRAARRATRRSRRQLARAA